MARSIPDPVAAAPLTPRSGPSRPPTRLVAAIDWYMLAVMALMVAVARIGSRRVRDLVVTIVSGLAFRLSRTKRRRTEATLDRVFGPRLSARRRRTITRQVFRAFWIDIFSLMPLHAGPDEARLVGAEHLRDALAAGRGAILWISNHWSGMSTLKRTLHTQGFAVHKVHAEHHVGGFPGFGDTWAQQRIITPFFDRHESAIVAGIVTIKRGSLSVGRELAARLAANGIVCISADGRNGSRFVCRSFLGIPEAFPTGAVSLARTSGAPLLPAFCLPGPGRTVRIVIEPAIVPPATLDREQAARHVIDRYVERLEHHARRHPSYYFNWSLVGVALPLAASR